MPKDYGAKGLAYLPIQEDGTLQVFLRQIHDRGRDVRPLWTAMEGEPGDLLLFAADKNKVVWDALGALRLELARQMELAGQERV